MHCLMSIVLDIFRVPLFPVILAPKVWQGQQNVHFVLLGLVVLYRPILLSILPVFPAQSLVRVRVHVNLAQQVWPVRPPALVWNVRVGVFH